MKLSAVHASEDASRAISRGGDWQSAVAAYLASRKARLIGDIASASEFEATRIGHRIKALDTLAALAGTALRERPTKDDSALLARHPQQTEKQHNVMIAHLLAPLGWREVYAKPFDEAERQALADVIAEKDIGQNQAIMFEIQGFLRALSHAEQKGHEARAALTVGRETRSASEIKRDGGPRTYRRVLRQAM